MPGTRTAPTVDIAAVSFFRVVMRLIDSRGDKRSVSFRFDVNPPGTPSGADIEDLVAALQAATNASVYSVKLEYIWAGADVAANAVEAVVESVYDNIVINYKDVAANKQQSLFIPAPLGDIILDGDVVDTADAIYTDVRDAYLALLNAGPDAYVASTTRFTERRDKNDTTPA